MAESFSILLSSDNPHRDIVICICVLVAVIVLLTFTHLFTTLAKDKENEQ